MKPHISHIIFAAMLFILLTGQAAVFAAEPEPLPAQDRYLLLDSRVVADAKNARLAVGTVTKHPANPLFGEDKPWEPRFDNLYPNVLYDKDNGLYKCWYNLFIVDKAMESTRREDRIPGTYNRTLGRQKRPLRLNGVAYAESQDGISWRKPSLDTVDFRGSTENNLVRSNEAHGAGVFLDSRENDPSRRYKMFYRHSNEDGSRYMGVSFSADGVHWNIHAAARDIDAAGDTHNNALWAPTLGRYVGITRLWGKRDDTRVRQVGRTESEDFLHWTKAELILEGIKSHQQVYSMPVFFYCGVYLGLPAIYNTKTDHVATELARSPDTVTWRRISPGTPLIPNAEELGAYDWGCAYAAAYPVFLENEIRLYYGGSNGTHYDWRDGSLCLAALRPYGFAGYEPVDTSKVAEIQTVPVLCTGGRLTVTADIGADGFVTVAVSGDTELGFDRCTPITETVTDDPVAWRGTPNLSRLKNKRISMVFRQKNARLYAFSFINGE